jgi:hypothetical protein
MPPDGSNGMLLPGSCSLGNDAFLSLLTWDALIDCRNEMERRIAVHSQARITPLASSSPIASINMGNI